MGKRMSLSDAIKRVCQSIEQGNQNMILQKFRIAKGLGIPQDLDIYEIYQTASGKKYIRINATYESSDTGVNYTWQSVDKPLPEFLESYKRLGQCWLNHLKLSCPSFRDSECSTKDMEEALRKELSNGAKYLPMDAITDDTALGIYLA